MNNKVLRYRIVYQDSNVAIFNFLKEDITDSFKDCTVWIENETDNISHFWESFECALMEICGVYFAFIDGYEMIIIKDPSLPNWGKILEDVVWCSLFFINPGGEAVEVFKNGKKFGKVIAHTFSATEPKLK